MQDALQAALDAITAFLAENPMVGAWYTTVVRFVFPILTLMILLGAIRSLWRVKHADEVWGYLQLTDGVRLPITHWENIIGRAPACDMQLEYPSISRQHAALIQQEDGSWRVYDLDSKGGIQVNGLEVDEYAAVVDGDSITFAGIETEFLLVTKEEKRENIAARRAEGRPTAMWGSLVLLTLFQILTVLQLIVAKGEDATIAIPLVFLGLTVITWGYFIMLRMLRRTGFEMEMIAFYLSTISLAIVTSSAVDALTKQFICVVVGVVGFLILGVLLRDLQRTQKIRWLMAAGAIGLLALTLIFGTSSYGAKNWINIGSFSFQPSELAKICYIFAGAATLDRLFKKRNLTLFIVLTAVCGGCLALMNDFGTALIFFIGFLVIAYLRSGDFATLALICSGCGIGGLMLIRLKSHIADRFATWGHAWDDPSAAGFQQVRTMSAAASGGLVGVGPGRGWLKTVFAGDADLVFGMVCEEWGLVIAVLCVLCIVTLAVFAIRAARGARSSFYTIAACAATAMLVFQTCLNVFGAVDMLPLTGVTFPFVSNGGSSMISAWCMLAFLKAADTRQNASFAVRLPSRRELR